jgi:hypothetical protein
LYAADDAEACTVETETRYARSGDVGIANQATGVGHQMPPQETWDVVVSAIVRHTSRSD